MTSLSSSLLCVGATGSIGRHVVDQALRQGFAVQALVRSREKGPQWPSQVQLAVGDLTRPDSLAAAVGGIDAVVFAHGTYGGSESAAEAVDYGGVRNVLIALQEHKVRIALMTAIGVTDRRGAHDWPRKPDGMRLLT